MRSRRVRRFDRDAIVAAQLGPASSDIEATAFVCPMHPDYTLDVAGSCPKCGMALVRAAPFDVRDYGLELSTRPIRGGRTAAAPAPVRPGETATWDMRIRHPGTGDLVREFESVHEKRYHLFVISQDMEQFQHIHPELQADGAWTIDVTLPKPATTWCSRTSSGGRLVAVPRAADRHRRIRRRPDGRQRAAHAGHEPVKVADDMTATVSFDPPTFVAGLVRPLDVSSDRHANRASGHRPADVSRRLRAHAHHERGHGGLRPLPLARHPQRQRRRQRAAVPHSTRRGSGEAARWARGDVRRPDAEARTLSRLDAVPPQRHRSTP